MKRAIGSPAVLGKQRRLPRNAVCIGTARELCSFFHLISLQNTQAGFSLLGDETTTLFVRRAIAFVAYILARIPRYVVMCPTQQLRHSETVDY